MFFWCCAVLTNSKYNLMFVMSMRMSLWEENSGVTVAPGAFLQSNMTQHPEVGASLTMFPCVSRILPSCVVLYQVELSHLLSSQCYNRRRAWRRSRQRIWRGRRQDVFGDSPRGPANPTVVNNRMFWWAALTSRCWFAWVEGAQSLGLVSLTFPVQQLIQNLKM